MKLRVQLPSALMGLTLGLILANPVHSGPADRPPIDLLDVSSSFAELAERALKSTVHLSVDRRAGWGDRGSEGPGRRRQFGSGFVVDAIRGWVVTNKHVVEEATAKVRVTLHDGRRTLGDVVGLDEKTDLAVVQIPEGFAKHQFDWGDSDALRPGHLVMALGNPHRLEFTTSMGVISALNREIGLEAAGAYEDFLQFDAFIDSGSSGGPLVDMSGRVVGVNTAIYAGNNGVSEGWQGIGYAVPSRMARRVVSDLIAHGTVRRGYLGIGAEDISSTDAELQYRLSHPHGVLVNRVTEGGPAEDAGIKRGDLILAVNGREVLGWEEFRARVGSYSPGETLKLKIWRNERPSMVQVRLGEQPNPDR